MSLATGCAQSMKSAYSAISARVIQQEWADNYFEKYQMEDGAASREDKAKLAKLIDRVGSSKNPLIELKKIYKPAKFVKLLIVKPLRALILSVMRAALFISAPFLIIGNLCLSIYRRSWKDLTDCAKDLTQLTRLFIRGVFKIVPIVGPLLARGWSVLNAVVAIAATKVVTCIMCKSEA